MTAAAQSEVRQFRTLVRLFAYRFFDTEILSLRGEISTLLGQLAALLIALSFVIVLITAIQSNRQRLVRRNCRNGEPMV